LPIPWEKSDAVDLSDERCYNCNRLLCKIRSKFYANRKGRIGNFTVEIRCRSCKRMNYIFFIF
jgi:uncharacterized protein with PIN domain